MIGENGCRPLPRPPKNAMIDSPPAAMTVTNPTGLMAYSMPRRNSVSFGDSFNR